MDSRVSPRTIALALLCLAVIAFAAATLDTTTDPDGGIGAGNPGQADDLGGERTPAPTPSGDSAEGRDSIIDLDLDRGPLFNFCVHWLRTTTAQVLLLLGLVAFFLLLRWIDDAATALAFSIVVAYPGVLVYLVLTACRDEETGELLDLSDVGRPSQEGGGVMGGASSVTSPDLPTALLLVLVAGSLVVVAVLVLTGSHDQTDEVVESEAEEEVEPTAADVRAIGEAAGRAADRIEDDAEGEFENEVYRAWAEMTDHLTVDRPESSTPAEFATAAVEAGMDADDVDRLTAMFEAVRYGGTDPTAEREAAAVEALRRIETAYAGEES